MANDKLHEDLVEIGEIVSTLQNINAMSKNRSISDAIHMAALRSLLPQIQDQLKATYIKLAGENPWEDLPNA